ncbi:MAG: hypothetical protein WB800_38910, partial [Streptosporangiaceae bacterium]
MALKHPTSLGSVADRRGSIAVDLAERVECAGSPIDPSDLVLGAAGERQASLTVDRARGEGWARTTEDTNNRAAQPQETMADRALASNPEAGNRGAPATIADRHDPQSYGPDSQDDEVRGRSAGAIPFMR